MERTNQFELYYNPLISPLSALIGLEVQLYLVNKYHEPPSRGREGTVGGDFTKRSPEVMHP